MRDYCITKGKYSIPRTVWSRCIWLIRDRERLQREADELLGTRANSLDHIWSGGPSDPVAAAAEKRERFLKEIRTIDKAMEGIPEEYRKGILDSIIKRDPYPLDANRGTYSRWKARYVHDLAELKGYL